MKTYSQSNTLGELREIILKNDIIKLINNPKKDEDSEAVREIAIECYDRCNFDD